MKAGLVVGLRFVKIESYFFIYDSLALTTPFVYRSGNGLELMTYLFLLFCLCCVVLLESGSTDCGYRTLSHKRVVRSPKMSLKNYLTNERTQ